jgi:negative regulator of flagellin synthesis FlgM
MSEVRKTSGGEGPVAVIVDLCRALQRTAARAELAAPGVRAGITESARELNRARGAVESAPETRTERVRALKQQIASGAYQPDPQEIARKILDHGF